MINSIKPGDRIGAIHDMDDTKARIFGFGVYEGDFVPPKMMDVFFELLPETESQPIPRLRMDSGEIIWGDQCIWGSEARIRDEIGTREVVIVSSRDMAIEKLQRMFSKITRDEELVFSSMIIKGLAREVTRMYETLRGFLEADQSARIIITGLALQLICMCCSIHTFDAQGQLNLPAKDDFHAYLRQLEEFLNSVMTKCAAKDPIEIRLWPRDEHGNDT